MEIEAMAVPEVILQAGELSSSPKGSSTLAGFELVLLVHPADQGFDKVLERFHEGPGHEAAPLAGLQAARCGSRP